jgi:DNA-directed RNA polymerase subunit E'/Rpb7
MLKVIKNKVEKKCNKHGYVDIVYKITDISEGEMPIENFNGCIIYHITYDCKIYIPTENSNIIGLIKIINQDLIIAINGPILIFLMKTNVDTTIWNISDNYLNKNNKKKLAIGDYVIINILNRKINENDIRINALGKLLDYATPEEVKTFFINKTDNFI